MIICLAITLIILLKYKLSRLVAGVHCVHDVGAPNKCTVEKWCCHGSARVVLLLWRQCFVRLRFPLFKLQPWYMLKSIFGENSDEMAIAEFVAKCVPVMSKAFRINVLRMCASLHLHSFPFVILSCWAMLNIKLMCFFLAAFKPVVLLSTSCACCGKPINLGLVC